MRPRADAFKTDASGRALPSPSALLLSSPPVTLSVHILLVDTLLCPPWLSFSSEVSFAMLGQEGLVANDLDLQMGMSRRGASLLVTRVSSDLA